MFFIARFQLRRGSCCQSNRELGNKVVNFTPNFIGKLTSSLLETFAPFGEIVSEFP